MLVLLMDFTGSTRDTPRHKVESSNLVLNSQLIELKKLISGMLGFMIFLFTVFDSWAPVSLQCLQFCLPQWRLTVAPANKGNISLSLRAVFVVREEGRAYWPLHWQNFVQSTFLVTPGGLGNISTVGNISKRSQMTIQPGPAAPDTPNIANCKHLSVCFSHHLPPKPPLTPTKLQSSLDTFGCIVNVKDGKGTLGLITALAGPAALLLKFQLDGMKVFQCWISRKLSHNSLNLL